MGAGVITILSFLQKTFATAQEQFEPILLSMYSELFSFQGPFKTWDPMNIVA